MLPKCFLLYFRSTCQHVYKDVLRQKHSYGNLQNIFAQYLLLLQKVKLSCNVLPSYAHTSLVVKLFYVVLIQIFDKSVLI